MNVCFETFGCRLNRAEALADEARALAAGHRKVERHSEADMFVIRACSVTGRAQRDVEKLVAHLERHYPGKRIIVTGCVKGTPKFAFPQKSGSPEPVPMSTARAYLKVQDGCSGVCTFCLVPKLRGAPASVPFDEILDRARRFLDAGYRELVVTGCNLSLYESGGRRLPKLLEALADLAPRVRLGSLEPAAVAPEVVAVMAERENICRFLHLPVQSGSDRILRAMNRPYRIREIDGFVERALGAVDNLALGCDMIAGFPGESDLDHLSSMGFLKRHGFVNVHAFPYSERPGTIASVMEGALPRELRRLRAKDLAGRGEKARRLFAQRFLGHEVEVVVEDERKVSGWTGEYLRFRLADGVRKGAHRVARRELVRMRVTDVGEDALRGEFA